MTRQLPWKTKPIQTTSIQTTKPKCLFVLTRGKNRGEKCGKNGIHNGFCGKHKLVENKPKPTEEILPPYPEEVEIDEEVDEFLLNLPPPDEELEKDEFGTPFHFVMDETLYKYRRDEYYARKFIEFSEDGDTEIANKYYKCINFSKIQKGIREQVEEYII
jgi:hypothetical protein